MNGHCENYKKRKEHLKIIEPLNALSRQFRDQLRFNLILFPSLKISNNKLFLTKKEKKKEERETLFYQKQQWTFKAWFSTCATLHRHALKLQNKNEQTTNKQNELTKWELIKFPLFYVRIVRIGTINLQLLCIFLASRVILRIYLKIQLAPKKYTKQFASS